MYPPSKITDKNRLFHILLGGVLMCAISQNLGSGAAGEQPQADATYREAKEFLGRHTDTVELSDGDGARVLVCPKWQARVMTSTCSGPDGLSFGFINLEFIEAGKTNPHFSNYGAEDRLWFSPEGGRFSLWFAPGAEQTLDNWFTPPAFNEGGYEAEAGSDASHCRFTRRMQFRNAAGTEFDLLVAREIRLLGKTEIGKTFGGTISAELRGDDVKMVAYETINTITNRGPAMTKDKGLVSMWILSMLNASPRTVIVVPYRGGDENQLGPTVCSDYFGVVPQERLKITPEAILFSADANYRSKIGTSQKRAKNVLGAIDFENNALTLARFNMPDDSAKCDYMNNKWGADQPDPYVGDVVNAYNDGPPAPGKKGLGKMCEIESLSPAVALKTGESLTHRHCTVHLQSDLKTLSRMAEKILGVDLREVNQKMIVHSP